MYKGCLKTDITTLYYSKVNTIMDQLHIRITYVIQGFF